MEQIISNKNVFYPPMGIVHITHDLCDIFSQSILGKEKIIIRSSSQPNSNPHLGTITTIMTCYSVAEYLRDKFNINVEIIFDVLENSPAEKVDINNIEYQVSLRDKIIDEKSLYETYLEGFKTIFDYLSAKTNIRLTIRTYQEFQQIPIVRQTLLKIINEEDKFRQIISPSEKRLHIRFPCPKCKLMDKSAINTKISTKTTDKVVFNLFCPHHGNFNTELTEDNNEFIDANTPLRDILQGVISIENDNHSKNLNIMIDGSDWSGLWTLQVFCNGLLALNYNSLPFRLFAPMILDWSGAKFSKSLYLHSDAYKYVPPGLIDFSKFIDIYGINGLDKLWEEVRSWASNPKKLFRNYTIDYFKLILE